METFTNGPLTLEVDDTAAAVEVRWLGKSTAREPGQFLVPVLTQALERSQTSRRRLDLDFRKTEYLNSSSITPIIRLLEAAKRETGQVRVIYNKSLKWQVLSFTALQIFQTDDHRIEIQGL